MKVLSVDRISQTCYSRRDLAYVLGGGLLATSIGCQNQATEVSESTAPAPSTSNVPIRIWLAGTDSYADTIRRGWSSISSQPLKVTVMKWDRVPGEDFNRAWTDSDAINLASKSTDLFIGPHLLLSDWVSANAIAAMGDASSSQLIGGVFPALRSGLCTYAGENYCLPISSPLPLVMSTEPIDAPASWQEYDELVAQWNGQAAEPTAIGWAGMMFLWRAAGTVERWLFDQNSFESTVAGQDYIRALQQMKMTCDRYEKTNLSPAEIKSEIESGNLKAGIGFPGQGNGDESSSTSVFPLPGRTESSSVLLDAMSPVVALSSNCRQTKASKAFIRWICGGEGSKTTRNQLPSVFPISAKPIESFQTNRTTDKAGSRGKQIRRAALTPYLSTLTSRLSTPVTIPNLTIGRGVDYYTKLDQQIQSCLAGRQTAEESLSNLNDQWNELTQIIGPDKQARAWRRAKGMRA